MKTQKISNLGSPHNWSILQFQTITLKDGEQTIRTGASADEI